jgi:hypothetical protein
MSQYIEVRTYFMEREFASGQDVELRKRAVDALTENGVETMRQLCEKKYPWISWTFRNSPVAALVEEAREE